MEDLSSHIRDAMPSWRCGMHTEGSKTDWSPFFHVDYGESGACDSVLSFDTDFLIIQVLIWICLHGVSMKPHLVKLMWTLAVCVWWAQDESASYRRDKLLYMENSCKMSIFSYIFKNFSSSVKYNQQSIYNAFQYFAITLCSF